MRLLRLAALAAAVIVIVVFPTHEAAGHRRVQAHPDPALPVAHAVDPASALKRCCVTKGSLYDCMVKAGVTWWRKSPARFERLPCQSDEIAALMLKNLRHDVNSSDDVGEVEVSCKINPDGTVDTAAVAGGTNRHRSYDVWSDSLAWLGQTICYKITIQDCSQVRAIAEVGQVAAPTFMRQSGAIKLPTAAEQADLRSIYALASATILQRSTMRPARRRFRSTRAQRKTLMPTAWLGWLVEVREFLVAAARMPLRRLRHWLRCAERPVPGVPFHSRAITPWLTSAGGPWMWTWSPWLCFLPLSDTQKLQLHSAIPLKTHLRSLTLVSLFAGFPYAGPGSVERRSAADDDDSMYELMAEVDGFYATNAAVETLADAIKKTTSLRHLILRDHRGQIVLGIYKLMFEAVLDAFADAAAEAVVAASATPHSSAADAAAGFLDAPLPMLAACVGVSRLLRQLLLPRLWHRVRLPTTTPLLARLVATPTALLLLRVHTARVVFVDPLADDGWCRESAWPLGDNQATLAVAKILDACDPDILVSVDFPRLRVRNTPAFDAPADRDTLRTALLRLHRLERLDATAFKIVFDSRKEIRSQPAEFIARVFLHLEDLYMSFVQWPRCTGPQIEGTDGNLSETDDEEASVLTFHSSPAFATENPPTVKSLRIAAVNMYHPYEYGALESGILNDAQIPSLETLCFLPLRHSSFVDISEQLLIFEA
ncbi:hypothetical protein HK405_001158 [Cladochytrium tenue]|nr:hypothetical protein HK405_001158 [Cladochytrium tenue]